MVFLALFCFNATLLALFSAQGGFLTYPHLNRRLNWTGESGKGCPRCLIVPPTRANYCCYMRFNRLGDVCSQCECVLVQLYTLVSLDFRLLNRMGGVTPHSVVNGRPPPSSRTSLHLPRSRHATSVHNTPPTLNPHTHRALR